MRREAPDSPVLTLVAVLLLRQIRPGPCCSARIGIRRTRRKEHDPSARIAHFQYPLCRVCGRAGKFSAIAELGRPRRRIDFHIAACRSTKFET